MEVLRRLGENPSASSSIFQLIEMGMLSWIGAESLVLTYEVEVKLHKQELGRFGRRGSRR
uniref:Uncharacterized protein n=1 Tax=Kalanchoe fedtschenkoi TaxID=63787 RepID=A0A7N0UFV6_KALFE